jgi:hypothetical protein
MICTQCATAADRRAPLDQHCHDPKCMCGHRVEKYRPLDGLAAVAAMYDRMRAVAGQLLTTTHLPPAIRLLAAGEDPDAERPVITAAMLRTTPHTDTTED